MRCADCETEPLSPRYCECCGQEIGSHQESPEETPLFSEQAEEAEPVSGLDDWAPNPNPTSDLRYEARQPLRTVEETDQATPASNDVTASAQAQSVEEPASPASTTSTESSQDCFDRRTVAQTEAPSAQPEATTMPGKETVAAASAKAAETDAVKTREALPKPAKTDPIRAENVRKSPVVTRRPIVPVNVPVIPERRNHSTTAAIAALVIGGIVVGVPWLRIHEESVVARVKQLANVVTNDKVTEVAAVENRALPTEIPAAAPTAATQVRQSELPRERPAVPAAATLDRKPTTTVSPEASTPSRPKPVTPERPLRPVPAKTVANKPVRAKEPTREVPAVPVLAAKPSVPVIAAAVVEVVAAAPPPAPRPEAVGPFFESNQVNEPPRMATRVEPRLPVELRDRSVKEVVVVRALVSQSGHPTRISFLRRSKTGPQLDDVVLAAVNQWTFSPAKKKGEPVSCWFNFAVPVGE